MLADLVRADSEFQSLGAAAENARAAKTVLPQYTVAVHVEAICIVRLAHKLQVVQKKITYTSEMS